MLNPFKQAGELMKMRSEAVKLQKELQSERIEIIERNVRVVISGDQKILEMEINGASDREVMEAVNKAIKTSQETAAKKLSSMTGGLSGLLGGLQ